MAVKPYEVQLDHTVPAVNTVADDRQAYRDLAYMNAEALWGTDDGLGTYRANVKYKGFLDNLASFGEEQSKAIARGFISSAGDIGTLAYNFGRSLSIEDNGELTERQKNWNKQAKYMMDAGETLRKFSKFAVEDESLKPDSDIFAGEFTENPSLTRLVASGMSIVPSIMSMYSLRALTGSTKAAYLLFNGMDTADILEETEDGKLSEGKRYLAWGTSTALNVLADVVTDPLETIFGKKWTQAMAKNWAKIVVGAGVEGANEGLQEFQQNAVKRLTYKPKQEWMQGVFEAFLGGAIAGGAGKAAQINGLKKLYQEEADRRNSIESDTDGVAINKREWTAEDIAAEANEIMRDTQFQTDEQLLQELTGKLAKIDQDIARLEGTEEGQRLIQTRRELDDVARIIGEQYTAEGQEHNLTAEEIQYSAKIVQGMALKLAELTGKSPLAVMRATWGGFAYTADKDGVLHFDADKSGRVDFAEPVDDTPAETPKPDMKRAVADLVKSAKRRGKQTDGQMQYQADGQTKAYSNNQLRKILADRENNRDIITDLYNNYEFWNMYPDNIVQDIKLSARMLGLEKRNIPLSKSEISESIKAEMEALKLPKKITTETLAKMLDNGNTGWIIKRSEIANTGSEYITLENVNAPDADNIVVSFRDHYQHSNDFVRPDFNIMTDVPNNWQTEFVRLADTIGLKNSMVTKARKYIELGNNLKNVWTPNTYQTVQYQFVGDVALSENEKKIDEIEDALQKIVNGNEEVTVNNLRNDLAKYGGTNDVTFVFGDNKKGLVHIVERHGTGVLNNIFDVVYNGYIKDYTPTKKMVTLRKGDYEALLSLDENGTQKTWLLTGWDTRISSDEERELRTALKTTQDTPTFSRRELGAKLRVIIQNIKDSVKLQTTNGRSARGMAYTMDGKTYIKLFSNANASTFVHEAAHWFFNELNAIKDLSAETREMYDKATAWMEATAKKRYDVADRDGRIIVTDKKGRAVYDMNGNGFASPEMAWLYAENEMFARGFEQYLKEGKAPSTTLGKVFQSFKQWLGRIYGTAKNVLGIEINDSIKDVYAKMLGGETLDYYMAESDADVLKQIHDLQIKQHNEELKRAFESQITAPYVPESTAKAIRKAGASGWQYWMKGVDERARDIDERFRNRLNRYEMRMARNLNGYLDRAKPFFDLWQKMTDDDRERLDLALKNQSGIFDDNAENPAVALRDEILAKYEGGREAYDNVVSLIAYIRDKGINAGMEIGQLQDYFPRHVKLYDDMMAYFNGDPELKSEIDRVLRQAENKKREIYERAENKDGKSPDLTDDERADIIDEWIRKQSRPTTSKINPGNIKQRKINVVDRQLNQYYDDSASALLRYITGMNRAISNREIWGYDKAGESIGDILGLLVKEGVIDKGELDEAKEILNARLNQKGVNNVLLRGLRDLSYMYTMGGFNTALRQLDDTGVAIWKAGFGNAAKVFVPVFKDTIKSIRDRITGGESESDIITKKELGIDTIDADISSALSNDALTGKMLNKLFDLNGVSIIDGFGKNLLSNALFEKYKDMANKDADGMRKKLAYLEGDLDQTIKDFKDGKRTESTLLVIFNDMADVQPISLSQMPQGYLENGNGRILYMLKTFMVKRLNTVAREGTGKIYEGWKAGDKGMMADGLRNLTTLTMMCILAGGTADWLIDLLYGRQFKVSDSVTDNILNMYMMNRYTTYKAKEEGANAFIMGMLPLAILSPESDLGVDIYKTIAGKRDVKDWETWKGIPILGRFYYWWFGRGEEKKKKEAKRK